MAKAWLPVYFNGYVANMKSILLLLILLAEGSFGYRVVCVYTNWSQYRPDGGKFLPEDVDASLCTHLIYVYAKLKGNKLEPAEWNDEGSAWSEGMYERVNNLKQINPELKTLLGVGGWMMGSKDFSRLAGSRIARRIFAKTSAKFLRDRNFDGLTIDWQHPTKRGGKPQDKVNFSLLLKELSQAFEAESKKSGLPRLLLTAGVSASREIIGDSYEVDNITKYTDFLNVMAYDLHGAWDNYTGHPSQLYAREEEFGPSTEINVDSAMRYWMSNVPDRSKLVLGVSTYGRTFTLRKSRHHEYGVPTTGPGVAGEFTKQPGMLAYYERCSQYLDAPRVWDIVSQVAYWYSGDQWIAGEDVESIKAKVNWTRTYEIGGMMIWSLDTDDFTDKCQTQVYPLLYTIVTDINDPAFVKKNLSVVNPSAKTNSKFTEEPRKIKMQKLSNSKSSGEIFMSTTVATNKKKSSNIQTPTTLLPTAKMSFTTKKSLNVKGQQNKQQLKQQQQKQQQQQKLIDKKNLKSHQNKPGMRKQRKSLPKASINKEKTPIKQTGKMKARRRFNPKLRRRVLVRKHKNRKRGQKKKTNMPKKIIRKVNKTPASKVILKRKDNDQAVSSSNQKNLSESKQPVVVENILKSLVESTKNSTKSINVNIEKKGSVAKFIAKHNPGGKQEKEKANHLKFQNTDNAKTSVSQIKRKKDQNESSVEHIVVNDKDKANSLSVKGNKNGSPVKTKVGKTFRIVSKRKQAPRISRRKGKGAKKATRSSEKGQNKSRQRSNSIITTMKTSIVRNNLKTKQKAMPKTKASVTILTTKSIIPKQTTSVFYSTTLLTSTTSRPVKSKEFQKPINKKMRRRKGKVLKRGKRLKRRRKKRPIVSRGASRTSVL